MLFNSAEFLIFFPIVTLGFFVIPDRWRWLWLLAASCGFYMAAIPVYIFILAFTITLDFWLGLWIERTAEPRRNLLLIVSIVANIGALGAFKYFNFVNQSAASIAHILGWNYSPPISTLPLPIGLSFHTFQSLAYIIDVRNRKQVA